MPPRSGSSSSENDPRSTAGSIIDRPGTAQGSSGSSTTPAVPGRPARPRSLSSQSARARARVAQPLVFPDQVHDRVDQREVRERLGEVAEVQSTVRIDLLGVEAELAGVGEQLRAEGAGPIDLSDLGQGRDQPERADGEGALLADEAVVRLLDPVAQDEVLL